MAKESGDRAYMIKGNFETWVGAQMDELAINNHRVSVTRNPACVLII